MRSPVSPALRFYGTLYCEAERGHHDDDPVTRRFHGISRPRPMRYALERAIEPSDDKEEISRFLDAFAPWVVTAVDEAFPAPPGFASDLATPP
jgi:hypothetical protein